MIKKTIRPRGRPRTFDEQDALSHATRVFWAKGFDAASIDDLVESMGVQRPSLYATFGDKATLFVKCLEAYKLRYGTMAIEALRSPGEVRQAVLNFMCVAISNATGADSPSGCLLVSVAPLVGDPKIRSYLQEIDREKTAAVTSRLEQGIEAGELPADFPCNSRAQMILDLLHGLVLRARIGASRGELLAAAEEQVKLILPRHTKEASPTLKLFIDEGTGSAKS